MGISGLSSCAASPEAALARRNHSSRYLIRANAKKTDKINPGFWARKKSSNRSLVEIDAEYRL
jgi:hypothetical protein